MCTNKASCHETDTPLMAQATHFSSRAQPSPYLPEAKAEAVSLVPCRATCSCSLAHGLWVATCGDPSTRQLRTGAQQVAHVPKTSGCRTARTQACICLICKTAHEDLTCKQSRHDLPTGGSVTQICPGKETSDCDEKLRLWTQQPAGPATRLSRDTQPHLSGAQGGRCGILLRRTGLTPRERLPVLLRGHRARRTLILLHDIVHGHQIHPRIRGVR